MYLARSLIEVGEGIKQMTSDNDMRMIRLIETAIYKVLFRIFLALLVGIAVGLGIVTTWLSL